MNQGTLKHKWKPIKTSLDTIPLQFMLTEFIELEKIEHGAKREEFLTRKFLTRNLHELFSARLVQAQHPRYLLLSGSQGILLLIN